VWSKTRVCPSFAPIGDFYGGLPHIILAKSSCKYGAISFWFFYMKTQQYHGMILSIMDVQ
jgi:hypothetical protein